MRAVERLRRSHVLVACLHGSPTPYSDTWLAARMAGWALAVPLLAWLLPLPTLVRFMWKDGRPRHRDRERENRAVRLADLLTRGANLTQRGVCLPRSLLAYRFLSALGANPQLMVAFRRGDESVVGHAWVVVDNEPIGERTADLEHFLPTVSFGARGRLAR